MAKSKSKSKSKMMKGVTPANSTTAMSRLDGAANVFISKKKRVDLTLTTGVSPEKLSFTSGVRAFASHPGGFLAVLQFHDFALFNEAGVLVQKRKLKKGAGFDDGGAAYLATNGLILAPGESDGKEGVFLFDESGATVARWSVGKKSERVMGIARVAGGVAVATDAALIWLDENLEEVDTSKVEVEKVAASFDGRWLAAGAGEVVILYDQRKEVHQLESEYQYVWDASGTFLHMPTDDEIWRYDPRDGSRKMVIAVDGEVYELFSNESGEWGYFVDEVGFFVHGPDDSLRRQISFADYASAVGLANSGLLYAGFFDSKVHRVWVYGAEVKPMVRTETSSGRATETTETSFDTRAEAVAGLEAERAALEEKGFKLAGWREAELDITVSLDGTRLNIAGPSGVDQQLEYVEIGCTDEKESVHPRVGVELHLPGRTKAKPLVYAYSHGSYDDEDSVVLEDSSINPKAIDSLVAALGTSHDWQTVLESVAMRAPYRDGLLLALKEGG